jgi:hypothetical protein
LFLGRKMYKLDPRELLVIKIIIQCVNLIAKFSM